MSIKHSGLLHLSGRVLTFRRHYERNNLYSSRARRKSTRPCARGYRLRDFTEPLLYPTPLALVVCLRRCSRRRSGLMWARTYNLALHGLAAFISRAKQQGLPRATLKYGAVHPNSFTATKLSHHPAGTSVHIASTELAILVTLAAPVKRDKFGLSVNGHAVVWRINNFWVHCRTRVRIW